ncbi:MAG: hypothetical protein ACK4NW_02695 [Roseinatronobacter sp.]
MKHFFFFAILMAGFISFVPSFASAQVAEARVPHSSGGTILQRAGRYVPGTFERPDVRRHARSGIDFLQRTGRYAANGFSSPEVRRYARSGVKWGARGATAVASAKAAPVLVAAGTAYGIYEVGKFGYEWASHR